MGINTTDDDMMREQQRRDRSNDASDVHKLKKPLNEDGRMIDEDENDRPSRAGRGSSLAEYAENDPRRRA